MPRPQPARHVGATLDVIARTTCRSIVSPCETADLRPYPFRYQIWFDRDAVRTRTTNGLCRRAAGTSRI